MAEPVKNPTIASQFRGLNNRLDPTRLGLEWQIEAHNVLCDEAGYLVRRPGFRKVVVADLRDIYATASGRLLAIDATHRLVEIDPEHNAHVLFEGIYGAPFQWAEIGYAFFLQSRTAQWAIYPDRAIPWGSLVTPPILDADTAPNAPQDGGLLSLVAPAIEAAYSPPPLGDVIGACRNQMVVGVWEPALDRSVLYYSRPDYPHHFDLLQAQLIPGKVTYLGMADPLFLIATDRAIYAETPGSPAQKLASFGMPLGGALRDHKGNLVLWTQQGWYRANPFEPLTQSITPIQRQQVMASLLLWQGSAYGVVSQTGDSSPRCPQQSHQPLPISATHANGINL